MHRHTRIGITLVGILSVVLLIGCTSVGRTVFLNPEFTFGSVERVAIVPFENLSGDPGVSDYASRVFMTELLAKRAFDIIEPGEVSQYLAANTVLKPSEQTVEQIIAMGRELKVQALIIGTIGESTQYRSGGQSSHILSMNLRMVETETGSTVWSTAIITGGPGFFSRLFGVGERTRSDAVRLVVKKAINTLVR
ncbi:MAG: hypothetical protein ACOZB3_06175 [Calditrichota bacterium]